MRERFPPRFSHHARAAGKLSPRHLPQKYSASFPARCDGTPSNHGARWCSPRSLHFDSGRRWTRLGKFTSSLCCCGSSARPASDMQGGKHTDTHTHTAGDICSRYDSGQTCNLLYSSVIRDNKADGTLTLKHSTAPGSFCLFVCLSSFFVFVFCIFPLFLRLSDWQTAAALRHWYLIHLQSKQWWTSADEVPLDIFPVWMLMCFLLIASNPPRHSLIQTSWNLK